MTHARAGSVVSGERFRLDRSRLFCALRLPGETLDALVHWQAGAVRAGRVVPPENLHVTLAFLGSRPVAEVPAIVAELARCLRRGRRDPAAGRCATARRGASGWSCSRTSAAPRQRSRTTLGARLERLGVYRREQRPWLPHVTVLRFRERPQARPAAAEHGRFSVVRSALYRSSLATRWGAVRRTRNGSPRR